jgi:hypothetical protein
VNLRVPLLYLPEVLIMAGLTPFARKYGPAPGQQKSLLTPLNPSHTTFDHVTGLDVEKYQRHVLTGYTVRVLMELAAFPNRELKPSTLNNPIHQIMLRDQWSLRDRPPI